MTRETYISFKEYIKNYVDTRKAEIKSKVDNMSTKPKLLIIQVGDNFASNKYVAGKEKDCQEVGIECKVAKLEETIEEESLLDYIRAFENRYDGIIVQLPLPKHINVNKVVKTLPISVDVDGFKAESDFIPCTPLGVYNILMDVCKEDKMLDGKNVVILGRSDIVGKPMANLLIEKTNATVTVCNSHTKNMDELTSNADIIISAIGKAKLVSHAKHNSIVIDVGINMDENGKMCGDINWESMPEDLRFITPVPGGVGLLTRLSLLENVIKAKENSFK